MRVLTRRLLSGVACVVISAAVSAVPVASGEPAGYSDQDSTYFRLLTVSNEHFGGFTISNPALIRDQGLRACELQDSGLTALDAIDQLQAAGPYSFDAANRIVAAASIAYCPDNM
ncbi:DUF732 domain-containing protein [Mycolicibacterium fluoranthenivorans]|uniref:DUF732 domain-containing protein n=1 Tax=Mycolicibacterium fluoranthenivorans TaxID=258505 RepID=A0A7G8P9E7_9MYCO|nr:DUF732 domain-containing protein [Mycolicibacterium fluoranthenivorans]